MLGSESMAFIKGEDRGFGSVIVFKVMKKLIIYF